MPITAIHASVRSWTLVLSFAALGASVGCAGGVHQGAGSSDATASATAMPRDLALLQQGMNALGADRPADARRSLTELLAINPEPWVNVFLAQAWCLEGDKDKAFAELGIALDAFEKDPYSAGPLACMLDEQLAAADDDAWKPIRSDARFVPTLARASKCAWRPEPLPFDDSPGSQVPRPRRRAVDDVELKRLRETYVLESVVDGQASDLDRVRAMCRWVHGRTSHDGWNDALPDDALGLLKVAENGAQWRCVQYGIVVSECLNAVGVPARVVGGRARDVETILAGAGHVFAEAWLDDAQRWVFVDAQEDLVAVDMDGTPLNSAQFRNALARPAPPFAYPRCLAMCMHFFDYGDLEGGRNLMLGPVGSTMPTKFQRQPARVPDIFTDRLADAYRAPGSGDGD